MKKLMLCVCVVWFAAVGALAQEAGKGSGQSAVENGDTAPDKPDKFDEQLEEMIKSFVDEMADAEPKKKNRVELKMKVLNKLTVELYHDGKYEMGIVFGKKAFQYAMTQFGEKHPNTLTSMNNLALLYYKQGRFKEAEPLYQAALQFREKVLGKEHPDTLQSVNNLAALYELQGRFKDAESLYQMAFQLREKLLGKEHPDTLQTMNNLAVLYSKQGRFKEAEPLCQAALHLSKKVLGKEHPDTLNSMSNLARLYYEQGRFGEAEPLFQTALQLSEKVLGKEHPDTLNSTNNLARFYYERGRYEEAEPLFQKVLQLRGKVLGKEHPDTLNSMNSLAGLYESQGRYGEAEPLHLAALQLREKVLGKEHPDTLNSMNNLALLYYNQGRYGEAEPLYQAALQLREKVLGKEHPDTLNSMNNLAELYRKKGRYREAELLYQAALQLREKVLGKEHKQTLASMNNLALLYYNQGRYGEAEKLFQGVLQLNKKILGKEHPNTLSSMNNLAGLYELQGRYEEAETLYKAALHLSEKKLGESHPNTIEGQLNYFVLLVNMKKFSPAFRLIRDTENRLLSRSFQELYRTSEDRIRRLFLKTISKYKDVAFSFARQYPKTEYIQYAAEVMLRWKQVYAEEEAFQHRMLQISHDPEMKKLKDAVAGLRKELSHRIFHKKQGRDIGIIWYELTNAESKIREKTSIFKPELEVSKANLDQVMSRLPKQSALIEFRMYSPYDLKTGGEPGKPRWAAYLLLPDIHAEQQIFFEDLGEVEETLTALIKSKGQADALYQHLLGKFDKHIRNVKIIYIAPDDILNLLSFAALKLPDGKYLVQDKRQIRRLQTGRDLLSISHPKPADVLVAMGGVYYGGSQGNGDKPCESKAVEVQEGQLNERAANELKEMCYLKESMTETQLIAKHIYKGKYFIYLEKNATESALKKMEKAPRFFTFPHTAFTLKQKKPANSQTHSPCSFPVLPLPTPTSDSKAK